MAGGRKTSHSWTGQKRTTLCLLHRLADVINTDRVTLFNLVHATNPPGGKSSTEFNKSQLDVQFRDIKKGKTGYDTWCRVKHTPTALLHEMFKNEIEKIRRAAEILEISIQFQPCQMLEPNTLLPQKRPRKPSLPTTSVSSIPEHILSGSEEAEIRGGKRLKIGCERVKRSSKSRFADNLSSTPESITNYLRRSESNENVPKLIFRAFNPAHKFRARRFLDTNHAILAPAYPKPADFCDEVRSHMSRDQTFQSPFMSFTTNPSKSLKIIEQVKAAKASLETNDYQFAVFLFQDVEADAAARFGPGMGPFRASTILDKDDYVQFPNGYKGRNEWLVYGSVDCEPLAVLDTEEAIKLAISIRRICSFDKAAGEKVGQFLKSIPSRWKQLVAYQLIYAYKPRRTQKLDSAGYSDFMDGIYGVIANREDSVKPSAVDLEGLDSGEADSESEDSQSLHTGSRMRAQEKSHTTKHPNILPVNTLNHIACKENILPVASCRSDEWETDESDNDGTSTAGYREQTPSIPFEDLTSQFSAPAHRDHNNNINNEEKNASWGGLSREAQMRMGPSQIERHPSKTHEQTTFRKACAGNCNSNQDIGTQSIHDMRQIPHGPSIMAKPDFGRSDLEIIDLTND